MRNSRWLLASAVFCLALAMSTAPRIASAGCWDCEYDPINGAYCCVGLGENNEGWQFCTPQWDFEAPGCKFSGEFSSCINPVHCVGCRRCPVWPSNQQSIVTSEIILFSLGDNPPSLGFSALPVNTEAGLDASEAASMLKQRTGRTPSVMVYEARTSPQFTTVRYTAPDKSEWMLLAHSTPTGFAVRTFENGDGLARHARARAQVREGQAAVVPVRINGKECVAVIYSQILENGPELRATAKTLHERFTTAAARYAVRDMMTPTIDAPRASEVGLEPWMLQALADNALAAQMSNH